MTDTYIFADSHGCFPTLESWSVYVVELGSKTKRSAIDSSAESSDDFAPAYQQATSNLNTNKTPKRKSKKGKGPRAVPGSVKAGLSDSWYFKITIGEMLHKKILPVKNCLIRCNSTTTCSDVKVEMCREMKVSPSAIILYVNDFLEVEDSPGRVGKYWSGSRKLFAVKTTDINVGASTSAVASVQLDTPTANQISSTLEEISTKLDCFERKLDKTQVFLSKGPENIYKEITIFIKDMLKCPICCTVSGDEIPHAVACCNSVFCQTCISKLVIREDYTCPLCKKRRGPLYPILLSGMQKLTTKVSMIPEEIEKQDS